MPADAAPATLDDLLAELRHLRRTLVESQAKGLNALAAAAFLGISRPHFLRLVSAGKAPAPIKLGGSTRWRRDDLTAYLNNL